MLHQSLSRSHAYENTRQSLSVLVFGKQPANYTSCFQMFSYLLLLKIIFGIIQNHAIILVVAKFQCMPLATLSRVISRLLTLIRLGSDRGLIKVEACTKTYILATTNICMVLYYCKDCLQEQKVAKCLEAGCIYTQLASD